MQKTALLGEYIEIETNTRAFVVQQALTFSRTHSNTTALILVSFCLAHLICLRQYRLA